MAEEENKAHAEAEPEASTNDATQEGVASKYEILREQIAKVQNIDRVLDVKLEFTIKIGEMKMKLRDILELNPGSIIEIDRSVDEPLNLQMGDKILAKGEVVTIGENLGLRIVS